MLRVGVIEHLHLNPAGRERAGLEPLKHRRGSPEKHARIPAGGEMPPFQRHLQIGQRLPRTDHAHRLASAAGHAILPTPGVGIAVDVHKIGLAQIAPSRPAAIGRCQFADGDVAQMHRRPVGLKLDRPPLRERLSGGEEIGQRLVVDHDLIVEHNGHFFPLHANAGGVPLPRWPVGPHQRKFSGGVGGIVPQATRALLVAMLHIAGAVGIPDLHLRIAAQINAAVGTGAGQHPIDEQFEIGVVAVSGEIDPLPVTHDLAILHAPMAGQIGIPARLPGGRFCRRGRLLLGRIEMRPAPPTREIAAIEQRHKSRRRHSLR